MGLSDTHLCVGIGTRVDDVRSDGRLVGFTSEAVALLSLSDSAGAQSLGGHKTHDSVRIVIETGPFLIERVAGV